MLKHYRLSSGGFGVLIAAGVTAFIFFLYSCTSQSRQATPEEIIAEGKVLSEQYCKNCHLYPQPALLDKHTWENGVLPNMARQLGVHTEMGQYYADKQSQLNVPDWQKIIAFYKALAPEKLSVPKAAAVKDWAVFDLVRPVMSSAKEATANTTLVKFDPDSKTLYTADASNNLFKWSGDLRRTLVREMPSPVSAVEFIKNPQGKSTGVFTCIGILPPNDELKGSLEELDLPATRSTTKTFTDSLPRPVQLTHGDFNRDGLTDYVVCGYGNTKGGLFLVQQQADHSFKKKIIRAVPGAIQLQSGDFNNDGWPDVMCLFAQADEGIWMFLNDKKGGFTLRSLLRFPPVYGSNSFQLVDMNKDGLLDIIYTCGDNNDYSPILKPYHGVYIFTNRGNWHFKQSYFYHINGASKAMAADFDGDSDMDIAVMAFFPDFQRSPAEGFTYMEQVPGSNFKAHEVPIDPEGRWLAMDVCDIDNDGDQDIVLGNFSIYPEKLVNQKNFKPNWNSRQPIILLKNKTR